MSLLTRARDAFSGGPPVSLGLSEPEPMTARQDTIEGVDGPLQYWPQFDFWVPADSSPAQVAAAYRENESLGTGYMFGNESMLFGWAALLACTDLLANTVAQLMTAPGSLNIVDARGNHKRGGSALSTREWLAHARTWV